MPDGRTLLEHQFEAVCALDPEMILYVSRKEYSAGEIPVLYKAQMFNKCNLDMSWLKEKTVGPLDTLWQARSWFERYKEVLILYNDALLINGRYEKFVQACREHGNDAGLTAFRSNDERFTLIPNGEDNLRAGSTFYYKDGKELIRRMRKSKRKAKDGMPSMVYAADTWLAHYVPPEDMIELGTMADYKRYMTLQGCPVEF